ncbi:MAG: dihydroorotate dehydrogenase electron transfer subunit [Lachnospiraceae bacterium]|nr:dihydroorotate dehydrogenase electron transfer subunit [Lachnospiraceae bacterium]
MNREKQRVTVISQECLADEIYSMWLSCPSIAAMAKPGQFINLYSKNGANLMPRPISICQIDKENGELRIVYRVAGKGTKEFSGFAAGDTVEVLGPLGNGFYLKDKKALLIGGGIGVPPMVGVAEALKAAGCDVTIVAGYRSKELTFLMDELNASGTLYVASDDGSIGTKGTVIDAIRENSIEAEVIYSCGPTPMLRAIKNYALPLGIETQISMEERMACGIGACLACVCKSKEVDHHTNVHNKRICKDGPVFYAEEIEL